MSKKGFNTFDLNDDFWDIEEMLPKKKVGAVFSSDTEAVEISVKGEGERKGVPIPKSDSWQKRVAEMNDGTSPSKTPASERVRMAKEALKTAEEKHRRYAAAAYGDRDAHKNPPEHEPPSPSDEALFSYVPENNPLMKEVTVRIWPARYSFYEQFRNHAVHYYDREGKECEHEPFFSFTPQYVQLTRAQRDFYFWFRTNVRQGWAIKADYSYILLLIYEIINVPDLLPPDDGLKMLIFIWESYRKSFPKLDRHLSEWVCDYCLIHRLSISSLSPDVVREAARYCSIKEFYVGLDGSEGSPYASALFSYASVYNYRNSKFITDENRALFDKHIKASFIYAFTKAEKENLTIFAPIGERSMIPIRATRDAFSGALCSYNEKRRIEVSYLSVSRSAELRYAVTDAVKFAENNVRALLGIRSRFHTPNLAPPLKNAIEEYFAPLKRSSKKEAERSAPAPAYDALYEPIKRELSLSDARSIEKRSWATTELLTEGLDEYEPDSDDIAKEELPKQIKEESIGQDLGLSDAVTKLINNDNRGFIALSHDMGILPDALCEAINDRLYDVVGDIVVEPTDGGYSLVVDYMEEISQWLKTQKK